MRAIYAETLKDCFPCPADMRLIDADLAVAKCNEDIEAVKDLPQRLDGILDAVMNIYECPTVEPKTMQWIPCSERMPYAEYGESDTVLTTCGYRDVEDTSVRWIRLLYFNGGNWCYPTGETYEAKVYTWMPLPKPWKGEKDG